MATENEKELRMALPRLIGSGDDPKVSQALEGEVLGSGVDAAMDEQQTILMGLGAALAMIGQELIKHTRSLANIEAEITGQSAIMGQNLKLAAEKGDREEDAEREEAREMDAVEMPETDAGKAAESASKLSKLFGKGGVFASLALWALRFKKMVMAFLKGPALIIAGIVATLGMIFGGTGEQGGNFLQAIIDTWEAMTAALAPVIDVIWNELLPALTPILTLFVSIARMLWETVAPLIKFLMDALSQVIAVLSPIIVGIVDLIGGVLAPLFEFIGNAIGFIAEVLMVPLDFVMGVVSFVGDFLLDQFTLLQGLVVGIFKDPINTIKSIPDMLLLSIGNMFMAVIDGINWLIPDWTGRDIDPPDWLTRMIGGAQQRIASRKGDSTPDEMTDVAEADFEKTMKEKDPDKKDWADKAVDRFQSEDSYIGAAAMATSQAISQMAQELGWAEEGGNQPVVTNIAGGNAQTTVNDNSTTVNHGNDPLQDGNGGKQF